MRRTVENCKVITVTLRQLYDTVGLEYDFLFIALSLSI
jgi:hypothetical protein